VAAVSSASALAVKLRSSPDPVEIAGLSAPDIHKPSGLSTDIIDVASHKLRNSYCRPVVDHQQAWTRALQAYEKLRDTPQQ